MYWTPVKITELQNSLNAGKFDAAIAEVNEHLSDEAKAADVCMLLSRAALKKNDLPAAIEWAEKAVAAAPAGTAKYHVELLRTTFKSGDLDLSEKVARSILEIEPENSEALRLLSQIHVKRGNAEEAKSYSVKSGMSSTAKIGDMIATMTFLINASDYSGTRKILRLCESRFGKKASAGEVVSSKRTEAAFKRTARAR